MKLRLTLAVLASSIFLSLAAPLSTRAQGTLDAQHALEADAVTYRYDSTQAEIEVYYGILQRALNFKEVNNALETSVSARVEIWQNGGVAAKQDIDKPVRYQVPMSALDSIGANKLLGAAGFTVPYSSTTAAAFIWHNPQSTGKVASDTIVVLMNPIDHDPTHFALGGIELASNLEKSNGVQSPFEKSGYIITPNPSGIFGENYTKLYYYTELYIPKGLVDPGQSVAITSTIVDGSGHDILTSTQNQALLGTTLPIIGSIDIDGLAGDSYRLLVTVKHDDAVVATRDKSFFFVSDMKLSEDAPATPNAPDDAMLFATSDFAKMTDADIDDRITQSLYLGTDADKKTAKSLKTLSEKQHFLFAFWRKQDKNDPSTTVPLSAYKKFATRVDEANHLFSYQKTPGWRSARGRVYIVYGPSPYITTQLFDPEYKPYIIWEYDPRKDLPLTSGNRPQFVFLDRQGGGNFVLVHSNVRGETSNPDWKTLDAYQLTH